MFAFVSAMILMTPVFGADVGADEAPTYEIEGRAISIPIKYDPVQKDNIKELHLYVSADRGVTWQRASNVTPDADHFKYEAPRDGVFSFGLVIVAKDGKSDPDNLEKLSPQYHVRFGTLANKKVGD